MTAISFGMPEWEFISEELQTSPMQSVSWKWLFGRVSPWNLTVIHTIKTESTFGAQRNTKEGSSPAPSPLSAPPIHFSGPHHPHNVGRSHPSFAPQDSSLLVAIPSRNHLPSSPRMREPLQRPPVPLEWPNSRTLLCLHVIWCLTVETLSSSSGFLGFTLPLHRFPPPSCVNISF